MAQLTIAAWKALYGNTGTVFPDNTTGEISEGDMRTFGENAADTFQTIDVANGLIRDAATTGTNTYAATVLNTSKAILLGGNLYMIRFSEASTGASTLNINASGAKKIFINPTTQADTGDLTDEQVYLLIYQTALDGGTGGYLIVGSGSGGAGSSAWGGITGTLSDQTDLYGYLRGTRVVTGADNSEQADDNAIVILNSATPFNFTLDQLTAASRISLLNVGAGAVTLVAGTGVTITGDTVLAGAFGTSYPSALVFYHTATTPRVVAGGAASQLDLETVDVSGGTITLDFEGEKERMFVGSASFGTPKTIALDNEENALCMNFKFNLSNVAAVLTFPTSFSMQTLDSVRWNDGAHTFTPASTGLHVFSATFDGTDWHLIASGPFS